MDKCKEKFDFTKSLSSSFVRTNFALSLKVRQFSGKTTFKILNWSLNLSASLSYKSAKISACSSTTSVSACKESVFFFLVLLEEAGAVEPVAVVEHVIRENVKSDSCLIPILLNDFVSDSEVHSVKKESEDICSEVYYTKKESA